VSVKVISVETGVPQFTAKARGVDTAKEHVMIRVELKNTSKERKVDYLGFGRSSGTKLSDNSGNQYQRVSAGNVEGQLPSKSVSIYPDESFEDLLVFQRLVPKLDYLLLTLPGSVLGEKQKLRFKIPKADITAAPERSGDDDAPDDPETEPVPEPDPPVDEVDPDAPKPIPGLTDEEDPDAPKPIPGLTGEDSSTEDDPSDDPTGIFGKSE